MPDFAKLELHLHAGLHAGANLIGRIVDHHFVDSSLPADGSPLDRESFALGDPPSPAYMRIASTHVNKYTMKSWMFMLSPFGADQQIFGVPCSEVRLAFPCERRNVLCTKSAGMVCYRLSGALIRRITCQDLRHSHVFSGHRATRVCVPQLETSGSRPAVLFLCLA